MIVCHKKVVRISLEGDEILQVQSERAQGVAKTLLNTKVDEPKVSDTSVVRDFVDTFQKTCQLPPQQKVEFRIDLVPGATPVSESPYRLAPLEMQELKPSVRLLRRKAWSSVEVSYWILLSPKSEAVQARDRTHRKLHGLVSTMERKEEESLYFMERILGSHLVGSEMDEAHASSERAIQTLEGILKACVIDYGGRWGIHLPLAELCYNNSYHSSIQYALFEALYGRKCVALEGRDLFWEERKVSIEIESDKTLHFVEEPKEIMDREI
ncbi:putative reverse transcriptase domain-containing protein [Tanacetum coccineum]|uniref:Reverse transcriptase domain-containing protein n=1 Tax=Tanacetum coccineum TaxID=301880 RepID=A0ABQ4ZNZ3_9ASTR